MTIRAWTAVVFDDFRTLPRRILEHTFEVVESGVRDFPAVKEELFLRSDEVARGELTQHLVVDVAHPANDRAL